MRKIPEELKFKIVASTKAHGSLDVHICDLVASKVGELQKFNSEFLGYFSFEKLPNGDIYILKHERRGAWKYVFTASQGDAEAIIMNRDVGNYPAKTKGQVTGHKHTSEGSVVGFRGVDIINCAAWALWFPYPKARAMMHYYQPDIGGWFLIVMKDGRVKWQKWLYKPFIYNEVQNEIIENENPRRGYVNVDSLNVTSHLKKLLDNAVYVIAIISDTHIGEKEAPCPESFMMKNREIRPSLTVANRRLNSYWYHFAYMARYVFKIDEIWHLGDPVAGTNPFEKYRNPLMTNLEEEADACVELIKSFNFSREKLKKLIRENLKKSNG